MEDIAEELALGDPGSKEVWEGSVPWGLWGISREYCAGRACEVQGELCVKLAYVASKRLL